MEKVAPNSNLLGILLKLFRQSKIKGTLKYFLVDSISNNLFTLWRSLFTLILSKVLMDFAQTLSQFAACTFLILFYLNMIFDKLFRIT